MPWTNNPREWPVCTVEECRHTIAHETADALLTYIDDHRNDPLPLVNRQTGQSVCICHSPPVATLRGVSRFPCDQRRR